MVSWWQYDNLYISTNQHGLRGVFAKNDIKPESLICIENCIIGSSKYDLSNKIKNDDRFLDLYSGNDMDYGNKLMLIVNYNYWRHVNDTISIYLHLSLINHCCVPNAVLIRDNSLSSKLYALTNIKANEEITISYLELAGIKLSYDMRQYELKSWMDKCLCDTCIMNLSHNKLIELIENNEDTLECIMGMPY